MEEGCGLLANFTECIKPIRQQCVNTKVIQNSRLQDILSIRMYLCELLVPSINEHKSCFAVKRDHQCPVLLYV